MEEWEVIRLAGGSVEFWREEAREYVSWNPTDRDDPDYPGHTYTTGDPNLPSDFPTDSSRENLKAWAMRRWDDA